MVAVLWLGGFAAVPPDRYSDLWGAGGERWAASGGAAGRLPDFSFAGYRAGERPPADLPVVASVTEFGARPDDGRDDTEAFRKAIAALDRGVLQIPAGTFEGSMTNGGAPFRRPSSGHFTRRSAGPRDRQTARGTSRSTPSCRRTCITHRGRTGRAPGRTKPDRV